MAYLHELRHAATAYSVVVVLSLVAAVGHSQSTLASKPEQPPLSMLRAEEHFDYLQDTASNPYRSTCTDGLKFIALNQEKSIHLSIGGQYRARVEHFTNKNWTVEDETFYSQRLALHASLQLGKSVRLFGEAYHGHVSKEAAFLESDNLDLHQGFVELIALNNASSKVSVRLGRQELGYGASRLVGIREGPNMRRSFDIGKLTFSEGKLKIDAIYGKEVGAGFGAFDNRSYVFEKDKNSPTLWGIYGQGLFPHKTGAYDIYYLGFKSNFSGFNDDSGRETRHSLGVRSAGKVNTRFRYNTEIIYQFGKLGTANISAFNIETDWKYEFSNTKWRFSPGIKLDWSSGDQSAGDDKVQTFNPMFVNPAIYSLAAVNTPANLLSFHPGIDFYPAPGWMVTVDYALLYRTSTADGLYTPPRFQTRGANGLSERHIGDVLGLQIRGEFNRNISLDIRGSYFIAGDFITASGDSENTFYIAPTLSFKF